METTVVETLERVTATLGELRSKHAGLLHELQGATQEVASLRTLREKFLVMASTGDGAAARHVLELEQKLLEAGRTVEGLQLRLDALAGPIQAAEVEWRELAQQAATAECARKTEELTQEAERLAHNKIALWRAACRASFDESAFQRASSGDLWPLAAAAGTDSHGRTQCIRPQQGVDLQRSLGAWRNDLQGL